jgi:hypothetical protein
MKQLKALWGVILIALCAVTPSKLFAQTGPTAPSAGVYVLVDTSYQVGTIAEDSTIAKLYYHNNTSSLITGMQFRVWYDNAAFNGQAPVVTSLNTSFSQYMQYKADTVSGTLTITLAYTGSSATFDIPDGELFKIKFRHSANFQSFYGSIDSIKVSGVQTFSNLAATNAGMDTTLTAYSYGGAFDLQQFQFHGRFKNITGSGAKNLSVALESKPKTGSTWSNWITTSTDTTGYFAFDEWLDTTYYDVRLAVTGDTMSVGNVISTADAHKINQWVLGQATPAAFDFYTADVNGSHDITITDAYGVFGRIAGRFSVWPNSVADIKFFTQAQYDTITNNPSNNYTATIAGATNFTFNILAGQPDSVTYYVMVPGDANGTGYNMARLTPIKIVNPNNASLYIIDATVEYDDPTLQTFEVNMPAITVEAGNLVNVPVKVLTGIDLSALQLALNYDQSLLEFKSLQTTEAVASWQTFFNPNDGTVEWGGYDPHNNANLVSNGDQILNLQFLAKSPQNQWNVSPLYVSRKYAGDANSRDMNITPTDGRVEVKMIMNGGIIGLDNIPEMMIYPNPTSSQLTMVFRITEEGQTNLGIRDISGRLVAEVLPAQRFPEGQYSYTANLGYLPAGTYIAVLKTENGVLAKRVVKNN